MLPSCRIGPGPVNADLSRRRSVSAEKSVFGADVLLHHKMDRGIRSQESRFGSIGHHRSTYAILARDPSESQIRPGSLLGDPLGP